MKNTIDAHKIIYETYDENVIAIRTCANWFKQFKQFKHISVTSCSCGKGQIAERWKKAVEDTSINLRCINIVTKKIAKSR